MPENEDAWLSFRVLESVCMFVTHRSYFSLQVQAGCNSVFLALPLEMSVEIIDEPLRTFI